MPIHKILYCPTLLLGVVLLLGLTTSPCFPEPATEEGAALTRVRQDRTLRVGINPLFKPFSYSQTTQRRNGTDAFIDAQVGIDIDIAVLLTKGLAKGLNKDLVLDIVIPDGFDQLIPMLESGEIDIAIAAMSRVFERALRVDFSDPYFHTGFSIMVNVVKGYRIGIGAAQSYVELNSALRDIDKESQLIIAVTRGKSAAGFIRDYFPKAKIREYDTNEEAVAAVFQGDPAPDSPQIMVHDEIFLNLWVRELPPKARHKVIVFSKPFRSDTYGFAVAKGNLAFLQILNLFISDKLVAGKQMEQFIQSRQYRFIPGIGIEPVARENNANGNH